MPMRPREDGGTSAKLILRGGKEGYYYVCSQAKWRHLEAHIEHVKGRGVKSPLIRAKKGIENFSIYLKGANGLH